MVVCGFGADGRAGNASAPGPLRWLRARLRVLDEDGGCEACEVVPTQDGREADEEDEGREGKADADEDRGWTAGAAAQPGGPVLVTGAGPPNLVLFFSFNTRFECFWLAVALGTAGLAVAA